MSEERMDRKSIARSAPPKVAANDCKKSTDAVHRQWPRSGKKRDGSGSSGKSDAQRRNVPPPRIGRGAPSSSTTRRSTLFGEEGTRLDDEMELGAPSTPGSKKQSLNHLLKFVYSPRQLNPHAEPALRRAPPPLRRPQHSKLFLQASCQVAVRAGGDYSQHTLDPDWPVDWTYVEHVVVRSEAAECPVCLGAPVAARVTRCGHVYCWPCALHYLNVDERASPPCPVCAAPVRADQLRSASMRHSKPSDEVMTMRLVCRERNSTLVSPAPERHERVERQRGALPVWSPDADLPYASIVTITPSQVQKIIGRERCELKHQILNEIDTSELEYLHRALELLAEQERHLDVREAATLPKAYQQPESTLTSTAVLDVNHQKMEQPKIDWFNILDSPPSVELTFVSGRYDSPISKEKLDLDTSGELDAPQEDDLEKLAGLVIGDYGETEEMSVNVIEGGEGGVTEEAIGGIVEEIEAEGDEAPKLTQCDRENAKKYFYFYQAADGRHVFLHGAGVRVLTASWGSLAGAPRTIAGRLLRLESHTVTRESRRHNPCTAHLPLYCPYDVAELELAPPHATARALRLCAELLRRRDAARRALARRQRTPLAPRPPHVASVQHFPPATAKTDSPPGPQVPPSAPVDTPQPTHAGPSFAKMASASGSWKHRTPPAEHAAESDDAAPPPRALSLADAFEAALRAAPRRAPNKKHRQ